MFQLASFISIVYIVYLLFFPPRSLSLWDAIFLVIFLSFTSFCELKLEGKKDSEKLFESLFQVLSLFPKLKFIFSDVR